MLLQASCQHDAASQPSTASGDERVAFVCTGCGVSRSPPPPYCHAGAQPPPSSPVTDRAANAATVYAVYYGQTEHGSDYASIVQPNEQQQQQHDPYDNPPPSPVDTSES